MTAELDISDEALAAKNDKVGRLVLFCEQRGEGD